MPGTAIIGKEYYTHEIACIDEGARVRKDTGIWHFTHVMGSVEIGEVFTK